TFEKTNRIPTELVTAIRNPRGRLFKFRNRRTTMILSPLNIEIALNAWCHHFFPLVKRAIMSASNQYSSRENFVGYIAGRSVVARTSSSDHTADAVNKRASSTSNGVATVVRAITYSSEICAGSTVIALILSVQTGVVIIQQLGVSRILINMNVANEPAHTILSAGVPYPIESVCSHCSTPS